MGSSKEAKKLMLQELMSTALDVNGAVAQLETDPETGQPGRPVFNMRYLATRLVEAFELPTNKALTDENENQGREAQKAMEDVGQGFVDSFNTNPIEFNPEGTNPLTQMMPNMAGQEGQALAQQIPARDQAEMASSLG